MKVTKVTGEEGIQKALSLGAQQSHFKRPDYAAADAYMDDVGVAFVRDGDEVFDYFGEVLYILDHLTKNLDEVHCHVWLTASSYTRSVAITALSMGFDMSTESKADDDWLVLMYNENKAVPYFEDSMLLALRDMGIDMSREQLKDKLRQKMPSILETLIV